MNIIWNRYSDRETELRRVVVNGSMTRSRYCLSDTLGNLVATRHHQSTCGLSTPLSVSVELQSRTEPSLPLPTASPSGVGRSRDVLNDDTEYRQSGNNQYYIDARQYRQQVCTRRTAVEKSVVCVCAMIPEVVVQTANFHDGNAEKQQQCSCHRLNQCGDQPKNHGDHLRGRGCVCAIPDDSCVAYKERLCHSARTEYKTRQMNPQKLTYDSSAPRDWSLRG